MKTVIIVFLLLGGSLFGVYHLPIYTKVTLVRSQIVGTEAPRESIEWRFSRTNLKNYFADLRYNREYEKTRSLTIQNILLWVGISILLTALFFFSLRRII